MKFKLAIVLILLLALLSTRDGSRANEQSTQRAAERIRRVENGLVPLDQNKQPGQPAKLVERMKLYKVPGVSVAVIIFGVWSFRRSEATVVDVV